MIRSPDFFVHVMAVHKIVPNAVFSPYPVGLIGHPGGDKGERHFVKYSEETDTYYTFRCVPHVEHGENCRPRRSPRVFTVRMI